MLRSEEVERISIYFGGEDLRGVLEQIGNASILQLVDTSGSGRGLQLDDEFAEIEKLEQRLSYFKDDIELEYGEDYSRAASFDEIRCAIDRYYSRLVEMKQIHKHNVAMEQEAEIKYVLAALAHNYWRATLHGSVDFEFVTGLVDRTQRVIVKKALKRRLHRNIFIKIVDAELKSIPKQKSVVIAYVIGKAASTTVRGTVESLGGCVIDIPSQNVECNNVISKLPESSSDIVNGDILESNSKESDNRLALSEHTQTPTKLASTQYESTPGDGGNDNHNETQQEVEYPLLNSGNQRIAELERLRSEYKRLRKLNAATEKQIASFVNTAAGSYKEWLHALNKEKELLGAMKMLAIQEGTDCLLGEAWIRKRSLPDLSAIASRTNGTSRFAFEIIKTEEAPPTHFGVSALTEAFQGFTDVFGVPKYREINPAIFLMFTFPFMFGAMFGDILHGILLGMIAIFMIRRFERYNHRCGVLQVILEGRYVMLFCAAAAVWFGLLYGDFGSRPVSLFRSQYEVGRTYPFGIDPVWHHAKNRTVFINSLKMKLSLILGFVHMSIGGLIAIANAIHFNDRISLFCTAVPQFIVFFLFLGYLVFLCVYKWLVTRNYPSIVNTLIAMYTTPFSIPQPVYPGQLYVQLFIFSSILFCIPWMLFARPVYLITKRKIPREGMLDLWITSGIHVVEFGLGLISNTSSYLRLWAVSLAHVQLTAVLHQFTIGSSSIAVAICLFPVYAVCTLLLLIGLEGLSSCLHALRLNWIEFFSKFYAGGGSKFRPLSFELQYEKIYGQ